MPDSPPKASHGRRSACPGRNAASAIRCRGFFIGNRRSRAVGDVTPTYAASTEAPLAAPGEPCPGGRGPRQARHGWRAPESGQDVLPREKRRSEEGRVGEEWVRTWSSRWAPEH